MLEDTSALHCHQAFASGDITAHEIVQKTFQRIHERDGAIGSYVSLFEENALKKARLLDAKKAAKKPFGSLAGVTVSIKDNIHIQAELTTCASHFLSNYRAPFSATAVELLEKEDAIIIGKVNLDEFAMGSSCEHSCLKQTRNPWDLSKVPGGSSGGSAAAVAARLCSLSLGSDTGGSIRQPAALCGIVGFKPTYGRVSRYGLVAFGSSFDQIGPFATRVSDAALAMEVLGRHCPRDAMSLPGNGEHYISALRHDLKGVKIGLPVSFLHDLQDEARLNFDTAIDVLKGLGAQIVEVDLSQLKYGIAVYYILSTAEASTNLARFDGIRYGRRSQRAKTLQEVYEFSKEEGWGAEVKRRILLGTYVLSSGFKDAYYRKAQKVRRLILEQHNQAYEKCDLIAMPVSPFPAFGANEIQDSLQMYLADIYTIGANLAGVPAVSVPSGFNRNRLPFGLQLLGPQKCDVQVLAAAHAYERATLWNEEVPNFTASNL